MSRKQNIIWDWIASEVDEKKDKTTLIAIMDGKCSKSMHTSVPTMRTTYQESYSNGRTIKIKYNVEGIKTSIETIYNGYVSKLTLIGGKWKEVREKRNDGTKIKYNSKGELIHYEDTHGNYWDKREMPNIPICPFDEMDDFLIRNGISTTEIFGENPYCEYEMKANSKFIRFS